MDYTQSQILTSEENVYILHKIAQRKDKIAKEKEAKRMERELTKNARATEKERQRMAKEQRTIEKEVKKSLNTLEIIAAQMEAKKAYKARWTIDACEKKDNNCMILLNKVEGVVAKAYILVSKL